MKLSYPGTNLALIYRLVHFISLRNNYKHVLCLLEPIILQLKQRARLGGPGGGHVAHSFIQMR